MSAATDIKVQLRVYLPIPKLGRQFAAYLGTPTRARGYPPIEGDNALIVEVSPASASSACSRCTTPTRRWSIGRARRSWP